MSIFKNTIVSRKLKRESMGNNADVVFTDTDRLLLQKDEEVCMFLKFLYYIFHSKVMPNLSKYL